MNQQDQGIMTYFEAEAHSFVLRIWQENRDDPDDAVEWRGWIEHVQSAQRHVITSYSIHYTKLYDTAAALAPAASSSARRLVM